MDEFIEVFKQIWVMFIDILVVTKDILAIPITRGYKWFMPRELIFVFKEYKQVLFIYVPLILAIILSLVWVVSYIKRMLPKDNDNAIGLDKLSRPRGLEVESIRYIGQLFLWSFLALIYVSLFSHVLRDEGRIPLIMEDIRRLHAVIVPKIRIDQTFLHISDLNKSGGLIRGIGNAELVYIIMSFLVISLIFIFISSYIKGNLVFISLKVSEILNRKYEKEGKISKPEWIKLEDFYKLRNKKRFDEDFNKGIYILANVNRGKYYVGQSINLSRRIVQHYNTDKGSPLVKRRIDAGDIFYVKSIPLKGSGYRNLNHLERVYIYKYNAFTNGYNRNRGNKG